MIWPTVPLGQVVSILSGFAFKSEKFNSDGKGMPIIRIRDVVRGRSETFYDGEYDPRYVVQRGDFLIGMDGEFNLASWKAEPALLNQRVCKLDKVRDGADLGYVAKFLPLALKQIEAATPFVTVKHLSIKDLIEVQLPLPPLEEQRRIAAILDRAEKLRAKRRAAISLLDQLPQAIFLEMFGDPAANPMGWPVVQIGDLLESANYGSSGKAGLVGAWPILRMGNLTAEGHLDLEDLKYIDLAPNEIPKYTVRNGDLLFNRTNSADLVGKTALYTCDQPAAFAGYLVRLRVNEKANPEFVAAFMNLGYTKRVLRGMAKSIVGMANINAKEVQTIAIPVPPFELQSQFAERVQVIRDAKAAHQSALAELDALFVSLQAIAFERKF